MIFKIFLDNELLWESENTNPGYGFETIKLNKSLSKGQYLARYEVHCYKFNTNDEVNGVNVNIKIIVE